MDAKSNHTCLEVIPGVLQGDLGLSTDGLTKIFKLSELQELQESPDWIGTAGLNSSVSGAVSDRSASQK